MLPDEVLANMDRLVLDGENADIGIEHELEHLKRFPFLFRRLLALQHKVRGDAWPVKPALP